MVFLSWNQKYINIKQITSIQPYENNPNKYSVICTSDGKEHLFPAKAKDIADALKGEQ